jgi:hypothetical protein
LLIIALTQSASAVLIAHYEFDGDLTDSVGTRDGSLLNPESAIVVGGARVGTGYLSVDTTGDANGPQVGFESGGDPFDLGSGARTIAFFVRTSGVSGNRPVFFSLGSGIGENSGQRFDLGFPDAASTNDLRVEVNGNGPGGGDIEPIATDLADGQWHHVAIRTDNFAILGNVELFINGASIGFVGGGNNPPIVTAPSPLYIGDSVGLSVLNPTRGFSGDFDDFRVYAEFLSDSAIAELAAAVSPAVLGDFNSDGFVDAADYTIWRDNLGGDASALNGNGSGSPTVVGADYDLWRANFGNPTSGSLGAANSVPEPASLVSLVAIASAFATIFRRRQYVAVHC